ncbi:toxin glutamine deamidase domain-containing protein [Kitasatospora sp. NPDC101157]|uniref:toxin glutamine deamidase domain-containing protein n=1 Tax=Kitasatospora sp. NPDC101157 TaxID=3364098 RepID=UPI00382FA562
MSRKLPEELVPLLARTGHPWPQADEDALRGAAAHWREFATEADRITRRGGESVQRVGADNSGHAVDAFAAYWRTYSDGGKGRLQDAHTAVGLVATAFDGAAQAVDGCKAEIIATLQNLAAELKQAQEQAAKVQQTAAVVAANAGPSARTGQTGVFGGLEKSVAGFADGVKNAAATQVAAGVEAVAVETAALKIAGLLAELGRGMKDALAGALKEPAAVALLRLGTASGTGVTTASYRTKGGFDPLAAGLPAALGEPGVLGRDGTGLVVLSGQDGKPLVGVPGLSVKLDGRGQPVLGPDGKPVILRSDGTPVADAAGLLVVTGPDGKPVVGVADLAVRLDEHGQPVLTDQQGEELKGLHGLPLADLTDPRGATGDPKAPGAVTASAVVPPVDPTAVPSVLSAPLHGADSVLDPPAIPSAVSSAVPSAVPVADPVADPVAAAAPATTSGPSYGGSHRAGTAAADWSPPARDDGPPVRAAAYQGGGAVAASWSDGDYPLQAPGHHGGGGGGGGPVTVRTDSVSAPPAPTAPPAAGGPSYGPGYGSGYVPAADASPVVRPVGVVGVPGQFGTPVYSGGYQGTGTVGSVGPGPLAVGGGAPVHTAVPFGSGVGAGVGGSGVGGGVGTGAPVAGTPGSTGSGAGSPVGGAPVAGGPQPGAEPRPGAPRTPVGVAPGPAAPAPAPVEPPIVGTTPVLGRPEPHHADGRRRDSAAALADPTLAWGAVPVATAHAMALRLALRARRGPLAEDPEPRLRTIADSRPYGLPGGLGPVDPEHQAELERRVPRDDDGLPLRHPDPAVGGWPEALNAGGHREPGRANNSLEIALSAVDTYTGRPTCAAPRIPTEGDAGERGGRDRAERELGAPFRDLGDGGQAFTRLADELRRAGHGAQAVLLTLDAYGRPHAWNAVNHQDTVTYLDHQLARCSPTPLHPATQGLWAVALSPEGRPLDLMTA